MFKKIFFWLYATLLALPMVFIGANAIYYGFNDNAVSQTVTDTYVEEIPTYRSTNGVSSLNELVVGNVYDMHMPTSQRYGSGQAVLFNSIEYLDAYKSWFDNPLTDSSMKLRLLINRFNGVLMFRVGDTQYHYIDNENVVFPIVPLEMGVVVNDAVSYGAEYEAFSTVFSPSTYKVLRDVETIEHTTIVTNGIVDSLAEAIERTFYLPIFSWVSSSPITQGLDGLFGLIGMTNTPLLNLIGYWTSISAIMLGLYAVVSVPIVIGRAFNIF